VSAVEKLPRRLSGRRITDSEFTQKAGVVTPSAGTRPSFITNPFYGRQKKDPDPLK
jgi:hypothetical protein